MNMGFFCHEPPARATSWKKDSVMHVASLPGFSITVFSQCAFGLKTPMGKPMKKETALLSNIPAVHALFKKEGVANARCSTSTVLAQRMASSFHAGPSTTLATCV